MKTHKEEPFVLPVNERPNPMSSPLPKGVNITIIPGKFVYGHRKCKCSYIGFGHDADCQYIKDKFKNEYGTAKTVAKNKYNGGS